MMKKMFTYACVSSETGEASTLSQFKKPNRLENSKKLVLQMQQHALIPKRRHLVVKETFLVKHCLLALRIHANFSSPLYLWPPQSRMFAAKILHAGWHNVFFPSPPHPGVLHSFTERLSESSQKTPFLATKLTGALTLLKVTSPNRHTYRVKMALCRGHLIC